MRASAHRVKFIAAWVVLLAAKLALAATMPLFGDEAFYAWEALHPAWAYSDLPGGTAAAVGLGTALFGDTGFGVRAVFLLAGALMPWLLVRIAGRLGTPSQAWRAGLWSLPLPLLFPMGFMALPDVLMTLAALLAVDAISALLAAPRTRPWRAEHALLAVALALGALAHYRFAPILVAGGAAFFAVGGWRLRHEPGLWLALGVGALAWWPVLAFNLASDGAGFQFQLVERHPWAFHPEGLLQPVLQAVITTPLLYALAGWALWCGCREGVSPAHRFVALAGGGLWLLYLALAPFVDKARFSLHWPIPAYLLATTMLPIALDAARSAWPRRLAPWAAGMAATAGLAMAALFVVPASPALTARAAGTALYPDNFVGWAEVAAALGPRIAPGDAIVADHFMLAAQLSFALDRRPEVFVLDHWNNHKHGRAVQIRLWGYDEAALSRVRPGTRVWVAFEVGETPERDRAAWVRRTCRWLEDVAWVATVDGPGGGKHFWLYRAVRHDRPDDPEASSECSARLPQA